MTRLTISEQSIIAEAVLNIVKTYDSPIVKEIEQAFIGDKGGMAIYPTDGAKVVSEDIIGNQECQYPFFIFYRMSAKTSKHRVNALDLLEKIGAYLESVEYPKMTDGRTIKSITVLSPAFMVGRDKFEDYQIDLKLVYEKEGQ